MYKCNVKNFKAKQVIYARFDDISAEKLAAKYYSKLQNCIMRKCKIIKEEMLLSPADVYRFNHNVPVYIQKHRMYFFINKIDYRDKLAKVELIAIFPDIES